MKKFKFKFKKGDWVVILTNESDYIKKGMITQIDENESTIPFTTSRTKEGGRIAIGQDNAALITFKLYKQLCG